MSRDDIIRMAREAGLTVCRDEWVFGAILERFAELVRADEHKAMMQLFTDPENQPTQYGTVTVEYMQREIADEREACAQIVEVEAMQYAEPVWAIEIVNDIRARGQA